jgi:hypothetical protein
LLHARSGGHRVPLAPSRALKPRKETMSGIWRSPALKLKSVIRSGQRTTTNTPNIILGRCPRTAEGRRSSSQTLARRPSRLLKSRLLSANQVESGIERESNREQKGIKATKAIVKIVFQQPARRRACGLLRFSEKALVNSLLRTFRGIERTEPLELLAGTVFPNHPYALEYQWDRGALPLFFSAFGFFFSRLLLNWPFATLSSLRLRWMRRFSLPAHHRCTCRAVLRCPRRPAER